MKTDLGDSGGEGISSSLKEEDENENTLNRDERMNQNSSRDNEYEQLLTRFIECTTHDSPDPYDKLIAVLEARGFLLEQMGTLYVISDDSFLPQEEDQRRDSDVFFLNEILTTTGIGEVKNKAISLKKTDLSVQDLVLLFRISKMSGELFGRLQTYSGFAADLQGSRLPVKRLDPFIARLVKSLSAAGIETKNCCDGHPAIHHYGISYIHPRLPLITFNEHFSTVWFVSLLNTIVRPHLNLVHQWYIDEEGSGRVVISGRSNQVAQVYHEIQHVAKMFYLNREKFRALKKELLITISQSEEHLHLKSNYFSDHDIRERHRALGNFRQVVNSVISRHQNDHWIILEEIDCENLKRVNDPYVQKIN